MACGGNNLNADDYMVAAAAAPMVDDDNEPAPENVPVAAEAVNDIFSGWEHSGVCHHHCMIQQNPKAVLKFWTTRDGELSNIQFWEGSSMCHLSRVRFSLKQTTTYQVARRMSPMESSFGGLACGC